MAVSHVFSNPVADGTITSIVRPSDWNSAHNQLLTLSGNTSGVSTVSGTNVVFQGGNNVTLSATQGANAATVVFSGADLAAYQQTSNTSAITSNAMNTSERGNYFYTSNKTFAGTGFTSATTAGTAVVGTLNTNGLSVGVPAIITNALTSQSNQGNNYYAASNTISTNSTSMGTYSNLTFAGAGIASVGVSNGSVVISVPTGGGAGDGYNIVSMGSSGNTTGTAWSSSSASIGIYGGNNITISQNNSNQLVISAPSGGGIGVSNLGNTDGSTGAVSDQMVFVGSVGLQLSQSTSSQSATISIMPEPMDDYMPFLGRVVAVQQIGQNTIQVQPMGDVPYIRFDRLAYGVQQSNAANSTGTISCTVRIGFYSKNVSTLSLINSFSGSFSIHANGTASSSVYQGLRYATMTLNQTGSFYGDMWAAFVSSTATAGTNASLSNIVVSAINSTWSGYIGVGSNNTNQSVMGMGIYTATSNGLPNSMAFSNINGNSSAFQRPQLFMLSSGAFV